MSRKMAEPKTEIGAEIRAARLQKGLKQRELADMVGVSVMTISRLEAGKSAPGKAMIGAIMAVLAEDCKTAEPDQFPDPFGCRDEILRFFAAAEDLIRALKSRP